MESNFLVPEKCVKCKSLFDLKYDLAFGDDGVVCMEEPFCWKCRVISLFSKMTGRSREMDENEKNEIELIWGDY